ncbi:MAG: EamA family transporter [Cyclobacteriaceae bacterium]
MAQRQISHRLLIIIAFLCIYLIWGTTYMAIRIGLDGLPPFMMAAVRFFLAGILMVVYCFWSRQKWPKFHSMVRNAFFGLIILVGGQGLLVWSEQYIATGYASVLVATIPLWFVIIDKSNWKLYFTNPFIILGVVLGFIGILTLFGEKLSRGSAATSNLEIIATALVLFGAISWVSGTLLYKTYPPKDSMYMNLGWQFIFASLISLALSGLLGEYSHTDFSNVGVRAWSAIIYLSLIGSIVGLIAYTWLLTQKPAAVVGTYAFVNPIIAVLIGWLFANETISSFQLVGMVIIIVSAIMINLKRRQVLKSD